MFNNFSAHQFNRALIVGFICLASLFNLGCREEAKQSADGTEVKLGGTREDHLNFAKAGLNDGVKKLQEAAKKYEKYDLDAPDLPNCEEKFKTANQDVVAASTILRRYLQESKNVLPQQTVDGIEEALQKIDRRVARHYDNACSGNSEPELIFTTVLGNTTAIYNTIQPIISKR